MSQSTTDLPNSGNAVYAVPDAVPPPVFPFDVSGARAPGWWGMLLLIATELTLFGCLLSSYFYLLSSAPGWPLGDNIGRPELKLPVAMTIVLLSSSAPMFWAERGSKEGNQGQLRLGLLFSFLLGAIFLGLQTYEYAHKPFGPQANAYGSLFYTITGFHSIHVAIGLLMNCYVQLRAWLGHFTARRRLAVENAALYWHFVDAVWILIFGSLYLSPYVF
jgi:heme/copper-type cytochrome/quinol oxidase subunit 3